MPNWTTPTHTIICVPCPSVQLHGPVTTSLPPHTHIALQELISVTCFTLPVPPPTPPPLQELSSVSPLPGCAAGSVEFAQLDLSSLSSVRDFARRFNKGGRQLDVLVCNAGIMSPPTRLLSEDGLELQFQVGFWGGR